MASHLALYRKYRPTCFAELVGQEPVAVTLSRAVEQGRVSHAYLFCGPRGTGKTSVARILARSLNCEQGPTLTPCGQCLSCQGMTSGQALDVIEIDAASHNGVDNIRELQDRVGLAPVGGKHKIYIIDEVHMLSGGAFNALLKTLEEPPPRVIFILATTDPHKVLPTIISRCQRHDFARIPQQAMVAHLRAIASKENITIDEDALALVARRAQGGLRDALSVLDQLFAAAGTEALTASRASDLLGMLRIDTVEALGAAVLARDAAKALIFAKECLLAGAEHGAVVRELMRHLRDRLVLALSPDHAEALDIPLSTRDRLLRDQTVASAAELMWMLESLKDTDALIRRSPYGAIWLDFGLMRICLREGFVSLASLSERVEALETLVRDGRFDAGAGLPPLAVHAPLASPQSPGLPKTVTRPAGDPPALSPLNEGPPVKPPSSPLAPQPPAAATPDFSTPAPTVAKAFPAATPPPASGDASPAAQPPGLAATNQTARRPLPPQAWERIQERVRAKSVPTAALLGQQASVDHWASDGALVIRMLKPFKDQFDRQTSKRDLLNQAITAVLGAGAFARLEALEPKASTRRTVPAEPSLPKSPPLQPVPGLDGTQPSFATSESGTPGFAPQPALHTPLGNASALLAATGESGMPGLAQQPAQPTLAGTAAPPVFESGEPGRTNFGADPVVTVANSAFGRETAPGEDVARVMGHALHPFDVPVAAGTEASHAQGPVAIDPLMPEAGDREVPTELRLVKEIFNGRIVTLDQAAAKGV